MLVRRHLASGRCISPAFIVLRHSQNRLRWLSSNGTCSTVCLSPSCIRGEKNMKYQVSLNGKQFDEAEEKGSVSTVGAAPRTGTGCSSTGTRPAVNKALTRSTWQQRLQETVQRTHLAPPTLSWISMHGRSGRWAAMCLFISLPSEAMKMENEICTA